MNSIEINSQAITVKEYRGQRVISFQDVDTVHQRPEGTAKRNFNANREHLIESIDFFFVKPADVRTYEIRTSDINNRGTYLLTESGYLMLVKSFTDDLAWDVQRQLVNRYFKAETTMPMLLEPIQAPNASLGEVGRFIQSMRIMMEKQCIPAPVIAQVIAKMGRAWNVEFPPEFIKQDVWAFQSDCQLL